MLHKRNTREMLSKFNFCEKGTGSMTSTWRLGGSAQTIDGCKCKVGMKSREKVDV